MRAAIHIRSAVLFFIGALVVAATYQPPPLKLAESEFRPLLLRPSLARTVSKPFLPMLVDILWLRTLNAIGMPDNTQKNLALYEYGVALTEIDPRFYVAYKFIGLSIPYAYARNTWAGAAESSDMFRRGLRVFPNDLTLHMYLGFNLFHRERKFLEASDVFARASRLPGALDFMAPLAVRLRSHSGDAVEALAMTREMLADEKDEEVRATLEKRLSELEVEVVLQEVDRAAAEYEKRFGRPPWSLEKLRAEGLYTGPITDAQGGTVSLSDDHKGTSTSLKRRLEIYE